MKTDIAEPVEFFKWQGGYGEFTVGKAEAPAVTAYIRRQKQHHADGELWEE